MICMAGTRPALQLLAENVTIVPHTVLAFLVRQVVDALLHHLRARYFHRGDIEQGGDHDFYRHAEQHAMDERGGDIGHGASR